MPVRLPRGRGSDAAIAKLAPTINKIRDAGHLGIRKISRSRIRFAFVRRKSATHCQENRKSRLVTQEVLATETFYASQELREAPKSKGPQIMSPSMQLTALDVDIFRVCRKRYPERIARVASVALYWSQFARHRLRGRLGIYKTDDDLADQIGRHPKTCGMNLLEVCTASEQPAALFEVTYGPKAGQHAGHCRWLFLTPRGEQIIEAAKEVRREREQAKRTGQPRPERASEPEDRPSNSIHIRQSAVGIPAHRQPQITPILLTEDFSLRPSRTPSENSKNDSKEVQERKTKGISELWTRVCQQCGRTDLIWPPNDVSRFASYLRDIELSPSIRKLAVEEMVKRLTLICENFDGLTGEMGEEFWDLKGCSPSALTFARRGPELLEAAGQWLLSVGRVSVPTVGKF